ncbi:hypothetical protein L2E81_04050 [Planktothrix agardhii 1033]|nr:hypothetical protein [Planktothrix agardhii 1033]
MTFSTIPLIGLRADHFRHPLDLQSTNTLKQFPGLDILVRQLLGGLGEQFFYLENIASSILVSDQQLPNLHQLLLDACKILDLEPPQLYIRQNPVPNAYTFAVMSVLMKLSGGSPSLAPQLNLDAFVAQARTYDQISSTELGELLKQAQTAQLSHPLPVLRAREIDRWSSSSNYQDLLKRKFMVYDGEANRKGGWRNW